MSSSRPSSVPIVPEARHASLGKDIMRLESVSDLPLRARPMDPVLAGFESNDGVRDQFVILSLPGYDDATGGEKKKQKIWLIMEENQQKDMTRFFALRSRIGAKFTIEKIMVADSAKIRIIYDMAETGGLDEKIGKNNKINQFFDDLISKALKKNVSDIHIEVRMTGISKIRFRRHGMLVDEVGEASSQFMDKMCRSIYDTQADDEGKSEAFREDQELSASIPRTINGKNLKLRFQSLVAYPKGYDVVMRLLVLDGQDEKFTELSDLGYSADQVEVIREAVERPIGAMFVAGVTGSGKSTTLKNIIMWLNDLREYSYKFYTIEDPPEYLIPRVTQIPVRQVETGTNIDDSPYLGPLKAAMRGDPDVIMIGEIRDRFTADGAKKATQSGHQVFSTLHASSAMGSVERLRDFGLTPSTLGSQDFIAGLIYQRLVPLLCPDCSMPFLQTLEEGVAPDSALQLNRRLEEALGKDGLNSVRVRGPGCETCMGTGVTGRTVCAEIVQPDLNMLRLFRSDLMVEAYEYWRSKSDRLPHSEIMAGKSVLEHALHKVTMGKVSPVDVETLIARVNTAVRQYQEIDNAKQVLEEGIPHAHKRRQAWEASP